MTKRTLVFSLSGLTFKMCKAKMDHSEINFCQLVWQTITQKIIACCWNGIFFLQDWTKFLEKTYGVREGALLRGVKSVLHIFVSLCAWIQVSFKHNFPQKCRFTCTLSSSHFKLLFKNYLHIASSHLTCASTHAYHTPTLYAFPSKVYIYHLHIIK